MRLKCVRIQTFGEITSTVIARTITSPVCLNVQTNQIKLMEGQLSIPIKITEKLFGNVFVYHNKEMFWVNENNIIPDIDIDEIIKESIIVQNGDVFLADSYGNKMFITSSLESTPTNLAETLKSIISKAINSQV